MKKFEITGIKDVHCLFCGKKVGYDEDSEWEQCEHLVFHSTDDGIPENDVRDGVDNLFVASCSVFPTGGSSNPTLTLMALTLRLAEHLKSHSY